MAFANRAAKDSRAPRRQRSKRQSLVAAGIKGSLESLPHHGSVSKTPPQRGFSHIQILTKAPIEATKVADISPEVTFKKPSLASEISIGVPFQSSRCLNDRDSLANMPVGTTFAAKARAAELNAARARKAATAAKEKSAHDVDNDDATDANAFPPLISVEQGKLRLSKRSQTGLTRSFSSEQPPEDLKLRSSPPPTQSLTTLPPQLHHEHRTVSPDSSSASPLSFCAPLSRLESQHRASRSSSALITEAHRPNDGRLFQPTSAAPDIVHSNLHYWDMEMAPRYPQEHGLHAGVTGPQQPLRSSPKPGFGHGLKPAGQIRPSTTDSPAAVNYRTPSRVRPTGGMVNESPLHHSYTNMNQYARSPYRQTQQANTAYGYDGAVSGVDDPFRDQDPAALSIERASQYQNRLTTTNLPPRQSVAIRGTVPYGPIDSEYHPELFHESAHRRYSGVQPLPAPGQSLKEIQDAHFREIAEQHNRKYSNNGAYKGGYISRNLSSGNSKDSKLKVLEDTQAEVNANPSTRTVLYDPFADRANKEDSTDITLHLSASKHVHRRPVPSLIRSTEPIPRNYTDLPEYNDAYLAGHYAADPEGASENASARTLKPTEHVITGDNEFQGNSEAVQSSSIKEMYDLHTTENIDASQMYNIIEQRQRTMQSFARTPIRITSDPMAAAAIGRASIQAPIGSERRRSSGLDLDAFNTKPTLPAKDAMEMLAPVLSNLVDNLRSPRSHFTPWGPPPAYAIDHSPAGNNSFFESSWGTPPARVARDPRYRTTMHEGRPTYFEDIGRGKGLSWTRR